MIEREIAEFGRRMGMPAFSLSPAGLAALDVERLGRSIWSLPKTPGSASCSSTSRGPCRSMT